jgi:hypothetical protein
MSVFKQECFETPGFDRYSTDTSIRKSPVNFESYESWFGSQMFKIDQAINIACEKDFIEARNAIVFLKLTTLHYPCRKESFESVVKCITKMKKSREESDLVTRIEGMENIILIKQKKFLEE